MNRRFIFLLLLILVLPLLTQAGPPLKKLWPFHINRFDKEGRFHGRWKLYDAEQTILIRNGRFRHGKEVGKWRYYYPDGKLRKVEYHTNKSAGFLIRFYHDNGQLEKEGMAQVVETEREIRYFWYGTWQVYDRQGQFSHTEYYEKGKEIKLKLAED
ncbi:toxin-antitoxin system YwqK family antitoxin [Pontibacter sp. HJ8]